jgi:hypothetical protein
MYKGISSLRMQQFNRSQREFNIYCERINRLTLVANGYGNLICNQVKGVNGRNLFIAKVII